MPKPQWKLLLEDNGHKIKLSPEGDIGCDCWAFKKQNLPIKLRTCKHLERNAEKIMELVAQATA